jgi:hypothetical protein
MSSTKSNSASVEELYLKEKKKSNIFLASTVLLAVLLVGSFFYNSNINSSSSSTTDDQSGGQFQGGGRGGRGGQNIAEFFDDNGEVDQSAVDTLAERASQGGGPAGANPSQFLERFTQQIDSAIENEEITQEQADQLESALSEIEV